MKSLVVFLFAFSTTLMASANPEELVIEPQAQLNICAPRVAGCANKIVIKGTPYIISYDATNNADGGIKNLIDDLIKASRAKQLAVSPSFSAEGYIVKEKGHFPNPMVEFTVFKLTYLADVFLP